MKQKQKFKRIGSGEEQEDLPMDFSEFNAQGNIISQKIWDTYEGTQISSETFTYNDANQLVYAKLKDLRSMQINESKFEYDSDLIIKSEYIESGMVTNKTLFKFDNERRLIKETSYFFDSIVEEKVIDPISRTTIAHEINDDGEIILETKTENTDFGKPSKIIGENFKTGLITEVQYTYDSRKNLVLFEVLQNGTKVVSEKYDFNDKDCEYACSGINFQNGQKVEIKREFNANNLLIKEEQFVNGELEYFFNNTYDEKGNITSEIQGYVEEGIEEISQYVYMYTY